MEELPQNAKRVFKGEIFEVWQWQQKVYDGSEKTFEVVKRPNTAQVIATVDDKILILDQEQPHRKDTFLSLPGGRCEEDEAPLDSAKRELLEETGYKSDNWTLWRRESPVGKMIWDIYTFIAKDCYKAEEPNLDEGERIEVKLITFEEFIDLADDPSFREKELQEQLLRAKYDSIVRAKLKKQLFG
jgi:ADP-ribose pyrophosphatase